ncbi:MAG: DUF3037 domain-containing protein [Chitinophagaceae bacterium]
MQENHLFEYAVVRVVPRVEREEFLNVGVILYSRKQNFLQALFKLDESKLKTFSDSLDIEEVKEHLLSFERICNGSADSGPIGQLDTASRFRWLTATRSTVVQTSKVHPGFCNDPAEAIQKLFTQLVL